MVELWRRGQADPDEFLVIRDLIDYQFFNKTNRYVLFKSITYVLFFVIPLISVLLRGAESDSAVKTAMSLCIVTQIIFLSFEFVGGLAIFRHGKSVTSIILEDYQNIIDITAIIYSFVYCGMRI